MLNELIKLLGRAIANHQGQQPLLIRVSKPVFDVLVHEADENYKRTGQKRIDPDAIDRFYVMGVRCEVDPNLVLAKLDWKL